MTNIVFQISKIRIRVSIIVITFVVISCETPNKDSDNQQLLHSSDAVQFNLDYIQSYGVEYGDTTNNSRPLSRISQIQLHNDKLFVLDRGFKEVIVFEDDSGFWSGYSFGSYGQGPGEFMLPLAMDIQEDRIYIYDYDLRKVNIFNINGELVKTNYLPISTRDIIIKGDTLFASSFSSKFYHASSYLIQGDGEEMLKLNDHIPITTEDSLFNPDGLVNWISKNESGDVVIGSEKPVVFYIKRGTEDFSEAGSYILSSIEGITEDGIYNTRASTIGINIVNDRIYSIVQNHQSIKIDQYPVEGYYFELFSLNGKQLGFTKLPHNWISAFTVDPSGRYIYLAISHPHPQIVKYRIQYFDPV